LGPYNTSKQQQKSVRSQLVAQPSPRQRLRLGVLAALDQRIAVRYSIAGMSGADTADYIRHHCKIAGRADTFLR
jgi:type II secretory pathway predicted ATPase ExeA